MARILWAEDDADVRSVVHHVLLAEGYAVDAVSTVKAASELLRSGRYDLVLADGRLPDGTGMEVADQAAERSIPALIITGYAFILRELAIDPTRYQVLLKPLRPSELIDAVAQVLAENLKPTPSQPFA